MNPHHRDRARLTISALVAAGLALSGCRGAAPVTRATPADPQQQFWDRLGALCGQAFDGVIGANQGGGAGPDPFEGQVLRMHVRACTDTEIRVPFHVGEDRSRTWVFTRGEAGLRLHHDHRHPDGSADVLTMYGGETDAAGRADEQAFPTDAFSRALFERQDKAVSVPNVWVVTLLPGERFSYALTRPGRLFRVDFDLTRPVAAPPPPWGAEPDLTR